MTDPKQTIEVFDRYLVKRHRDRLAKDPETGGFLFREIADQLVDRLADVHRIFGMAADFGARDGYLAERLLQNGKVEKCLQVEWVTSFIPLMSRIANSEAVISDDEFLPFQDASFDLITSCLCLHWINDLPGFLVQVNRVLQADGLFQAAILGGETLNELRDCLMNAELEITGGVSPRTSPMVDLCDAAALLQRAGFALPVADMERITVTYSSMFHLMADLRAMGETNAVLDRLRIPTRRAVFMKAAELYHARYSDGKGGLLASFDVLFMHGWHPDSSQPRPLRPGQAKYRLADVLDTTEQNLPN